MEAKFSSSPLNCLLFHATHEKRKRDPVLLLLSFYADDPLVFLVLVVRLLLMSQEQNAGSASNCFRHRGSTKYSQGFVVLFNSHFFCCYKAGKRV